MFLQINAFETLLTSIVIMLLAILLIGLFLKRLNQPYYVAYIIAGILLGPHFAKVFTETDTATSVGELGLLIQMFFIGTHLEVQAMIKNIKKPVLGVLAQLLFSFICILILGILKDWNINEILLFSFIISLSSSAIILEYLEKTGELTRSLGMLVTGILIMQDFLFVPMLLTLNFISKSDYNIYEITFLFGSLVAVSYLLRQLFLKRTIKITIPHFLFSDHEMQLFLGLLICFGFSLFTQRLHLSAALGALVAGILISQSNSMRWLEQNLVPLRVFFLSLFFLSIGLQINLAFLISNIQLILIITGIIFIVNCSINALIFKLLGESWRSSIYAGALLSQIGEFSLVLCIVARNLNLVEEFWYQLTLSVITCSMLFSSLWISIIRAFIFKQPSHIRDTGKLVIKKLLLHLNK